MDDDASDTQAFLAVSAIALGVGLIHQHIRFPRFFEVRHIKLVYLITTPMVAAVYGLILKLGTISVYVLGAIVLSYGCVLFVLLSSALIHGGARYLTEKRGKNWVKEIDYFYLFFGGIGVFGMVNRLPVVSGKISTMEVVAPMVLMTAIVLRAIKTRAEIGGWNEPDFVYRSHRMLF